MSPFISESQPELSKDHMGLQRERGGHKGLIKRAKENIAYLKKFCVYKQKIIDENIITEIVKG